MRRTTHALISVFTLLVTALLFPLAMAAPAHAANGCGSDWYKESDGYFTKGPTTWQLEGTRSVVAWHEGRVRFCTKNNLFNDHENRKVIVGTTPDYELTTFGKRFGKLSKWCVTQQVAVKVKDGETKSQVGVSGGTNTSVSLTVSIDDVYVSAKQKSCGRRARTHSMDIANFKVTGPAGSRIPWVRQTTTLQGSYWVNGDKKTFTRILKEYDYS